MCRTEMISCQPIKVRGCFCDHKETTVNNVQPCEFVDRPATSVDIGDSAMPLEQDSSYAFARDEAAWDLCVEFARHGLLSSLPHPR